MSSSGRPGTTRTQPRNTSVLLRNHYIYRYLTSDAVALQPGATRYTVAVCTRSRESGTLNTVKRVGEFLPQGRSTVPAMSEWHEIESVGSNPFEDSSTVCSQVQAVFWPQISLRQATRDATAYKICRHKSFRVCSLKSIVDGVGDLLFALRKKNAGRRRVGLAKAALAWDGSARLSSRHPKSRRDFDHWGWIGLTWRSFSTWIVTGSSCGGAVARRHPPRLPRRKRSTSSAKMQRLHSGNARGRLPPCARTTARGCVRHARRG